MLALAKVNRKDVFYDLGSGRGLVVRIAGTEFIPRKAIGVESDRRAHERARMTALRHLSKSELGRIDFWYRYLDDPDIDYSDATVVYNSLEEDEDEVVLYKRAFRKRLRVVKKDLPFVSFEPSSVSRRHSSCWFFVMKFPLKKVRSKRKWASLVLGKTNTTMKDVYCYYWRQLRRRKIDKPDVGVGHLKNLVSKRF